MSTTIPQPVAVTQTIASVHVSAATIADDGSIVCRWTGLDGSGNALLRQNAAFTAAAAAPLLALSGNSLLAALESAIAGALTSTKQPPPEQLPSPARAAAAAATAAIAAGKVGP